MVGMFLCDSGSQAEVLGDVPGCVWSQQNNTCFSFTATEMHVNFQRNEVKSAGGNLKTNGMLWRMF